jgi:hypothetical protein
MHSSFVTDFPVFNINANRIIESVPSSTKLVHTGQLWLPSVRMLPVTFLSLLYSPPYLSSSLSFSDCITLSLAAKLFISKFSLGRRLQNSVCRCGRSQRPLLDPVVPEVIFELGLAPRGQQDNFGCMYLGHTCLWYVLLCC